ncbi:DMT family transporter [Thermoleophilia bacterium SCSIO 60948]|nr:DMT family transporter [Thermoleophilia bacterium SCSIO 60948]
MSGAAWAAVSGAGFGLFQAFNARAVRNLSSVYLSTFLQLVLATLVLGLAAAVAGELGDLGAVPLDAYALFAAAGMVHFFVGWTTLNFSQSRIGAARTSPLIATTPLFGLVLGIVFAGEIPAPIAALGVALVIVGAFAVSDPGSGERAAFSESVWGFATAACWATSAVITAEALEHFDAPLLGVTLGMAAATLGYAFVLALSNEQLGSIGNERSGLYWKLAAGLIVGLATWGRYESLDTTAIATVLALQLLSVPVVLALAPMISGRSVEIVNPRIVGGAALVVGGSLILLLA